MNSYVMGLHEVDHSKHMSVGGKGANLGELFKLEGLRVPDGFCITVDVFQRVVAATPAVKKLLNRLVLVDLENADQIPELGAKLREVIEQCSIPQEIEMELSKHIYRIGVSNAYAVRSSTTAEDSRDTSFAGQHDTYLNIVGRDAIIKHVKKCWASLYSDRAIMYRLRNGIDHHSVQLSVVIQLMLFPQVSGIAFTADPISGSRKILAIDAGYGLGEALVSGLVDGDHYKVRNGQIIEKSIAVKKIAIYANENGGTTTIDIESHKQNVPVLTHEQVLQLERQARSIEAHFDCPQDIEWCIVNDMLYIVQSRPITTLFPIPEANDDANHIYVSVGHQQMMTDPIKPLGLSFYLLTTPAPMRSAGGRLFVDVTKQLISPMSRSVTLNRLGESDPLIKDALLTIIERGDFLELTYQHTEELGIAKVSTEATEKSGIDHIVKNTDPSIIATLISRNESSLENLKQSIEKLSGEELFTYLLEDILQLKGILFNPESSNVIMAAMQARNWINEHMNEWLNEKNAADTLCQSVPNNVTSEMGLALLDVADAIRPYPEIVAYLQQQTTSMEDDWLDKLDFAHGGQEARAAIEQFLSKYGMRCTGEIDITRTRWSEDPTALIPMILGNIRSFEPEESRRRFERGLQAAMDKEQEILEQLRLLPDGHLKVKQTKQMINMLRCYSGYREYPKYAMVNRYYIYKQALLKEAKRLVSAGILQDAKDIYDLTFEELRELVHTDKLDLQLIHERKEAYTWYEKLKTPRVITSDGEIVSGQYKKDNLPATAIRGLPVSSGTVEGRARVITRLDEAELEDGDILVTAFTDPSWTPLFISAKGLVTEVGGMMTHGAVIAREYGLPAIVGVEHATTRIKDGQRIRVHGTDGYVELL